MLQRSLARPPEIDHVTNVIEHLANFSHFRPILREKKSRNATRGLWRVKASIFCSKGIHSSKMKNGRSAVRDGRAACPDSPDSTLTAGLTAASKVQVCARLV